MHLKHGATRRAEGAALGGKAQAMPRWRKREESETRTWQHLALEAVLPTPPMVRSMLVAKAGMALPARVCTSAWCQHGVRMPCTQTRTPQPGQRTHSHVSESDSDSNACEVHSKIA